MIAYTIGGHSLNTEPVLVHIEGDPDSPINGGTLCPKGASTLQLAMNQRRAEPDVLGAGRHRVGAHLLGRRHGEDGPLVKDARDDFTHRTTRATVNRQTGFAFLGGATISNEEGYLTAKLMRALGTVYLEQQARVLTRSHGGQFGRQRAEGP